MKKRIFISVILLILLVGILTGGIFLLRKNSEKISKKEEMNKQAVEIEKEEKEKKKAEEGKISSQINIQFENMNVLDSYFSAEEIKGLEEQAESFLRQDETFDSVSKMICTDDAYETQNQIKFYFTLDDGTLLFTNYKKEEKKFLFWTQEKEYADTAIADWMQKKESETKAVDTSSWEEEQQLPKAQNENGQEDIPVALSGKENLQGKIPEESLNNLEKEMQKFLEGNNELRREISIPSDKIVQTDQEITFEADFTTERIDKKHLQVTYHIAAGTFGFSLQ